MSREIISLIGVSYYELRYESMENLEIRIKQNLMYYFEKIPHMTQDEKMELLHKVKITRKDKFRFAHEKTQDISKERIQLVLSQLAKLFRVLNNDINA